MRSRRRGRRLADAGQSLGELSYDTYRPRLTFCCCTMFLHHVRTRVDGRSNYFCICTRSSTHDFGPRVCPVLELQQQAPPARDAATPPARALHKLARRRPDDRWRHRSSAVRRDAGQQGDVGPSGSGAGASQHRAVGGPQHVVRRPERAGLPGWSKVTSAPRAPAGVGREGGARGARLWRAGRSAAGGGDAAASDLQIKGGGARQGTR